MARLAARYPGYGWEHNAGYTTRSHVAGLRELGLTPHHRRTYARIRAILEGDQLMLDLLAGEGGSAVDVTGFDLDGTSEDRFIAIPIDGAGEPSEALAMVEVSLAG